MALRFSLLTFCLCANLYLLGAMLILLRVQYPLFGAVPRDDFAAVYSGFGSRLALPMVAPEFLAFLAVLPLLAWRPSGVPAWSVYSAIAAGIGYFAITFGLHLPVHKLLAAGDNSAPVITALVSTHAARTWLQAVKCLLLSWMMVAGATVSNNGA